MRGVRTRVTTHSVVRLSLVVLAGVFCGSVTMGAWTAYNLAIRAHILRRVVIDQSIKFWPDVSSNPAAPQLEPSAEQRTAFRVGVLLGGRKPAERWRTESLRRRIIRSSAYAGPYGNDPTQTHPFLRPELGVFWNPRYYRPEDRRQIRMDTCSHLMERCRTVDGTVADCLRENRYVCGEDSAVHSGACCPQECLDRSLDITTQAADTPLKIIDLVIGQDSCISNL